MPSPALRRSPTSRGDNDNLMRLAEVRDLIGGQGWFDLHQYRMGPEGGFVMHWSRLVDAPIAAIMLLATALTGSARPARRSALVLWPALLLFAAALFLIMLRARAHLGRRRGVLPALVIGGAALHFIGIFVPGAIDHHNVQLVLTLAIGPRCSDRRRSAARRRAAGACGGAHAGGRHGDRALRGGRRPGRGGCSSWSAAGREARTAAGFGLGFAAIAALAFVATVARRLGRATCDAYSVAQFAVAALAAPGWRWPSRAGPLATALVRRFVRARGLLGWLAGGLVLRRFFPQCLADPYAGLDPRLRLLARGGHRGAAAVAVAVATMPAMAVSYYATPLLAALRRRRHGAGRRGGAPTWIVPASSPARSR